MMLASILIVTVRAAGNCQLVIDSDVVNTPTTWTFTYRPGGSNLAQTAMKFTFTEASGIMPTTPIACAAAGDTTAYNAIGCTATLGTDPYVIVTGLNSNKFQYQVEITSIVNAPSTALVTDILCEFCADSTCSSVVEEGDKSQITFTADVLRADDVSIRSTNHLNGETGSTLEFGLLLGNKLVKDGTIIIDMPKQNYWFTFLGSPNRECLVEDCDGAVAQITVAWAESDVATVENNIPFDTGASCIGTMSTLTPGACLIVEAIDSLNDRLQINLKNTAAIPATNHLRVKIYPVRNPPSKAPLTTFKGWTGDSRFNEIEAFENINMDITLPNGFSSDSYAKAIGFTSGSSQDPTLISATDVIYQFELYTQFNDIPNYSMITIGWPQDWTLDCSLTYTTVCTNGCDSSSIVTSCNTVQQRLEIQNGYDPTGLFPYIQYQVGKIEFTVSGITNPSTDVGKYFTVTTWHNYTGTFYEIDASYTMFYVEFKTGSILINDIRPNSTMIYSTTGTYYFNFTPENIMTTDMILNIELPAQLQVQQNAACIVYAITDSTAIASTYSCKADANNNKVTLQYFLNANTNAGDVIEFYLDSIRNPGDFSTPGEVSMNIQTPTGGQVDTGTYNAWALGDTLFNSSFIEEFTVEADNLMAGVEGVTYKFHVHPHSRVVMGAYLVLDLPSEIEVTNPTGLSRGCSDGDISGFSYSVLSCTYNFATHQVTLEQGYKFAYSDGDPPEIYFTLTNFRNPRSTAPTSMFNITILSSSDADLFYFNTTQGPQVQMTQTPSPQAISFERSTRVNGVKSNYTWYIVTQNHYQDGDAITFELPDGVRFTDNSKAFGISTNVEGLMTSRLSGDRQAISIDLKINVGNVGRLLKGRYLEQIDGGSIIQLMLTNVTSPSSFRPLDDQIQYRVTNTDGDLIETMISGLEVQNSLQGAINPNRAGILPDYWDNNVLANYTLGFEFLNFEQNLQIWVTVPSEIQIPTEEENGPLKCRGIKGTDRAELTCVVFYENSTVLIIDAVTSKEVAPAQIEIQLQSLRNPLTNIITSSFVLETRTYDGYPMDKVNTNLEVNFYCIFPCRGCQEDTPQICESCYTSTSSFIYLWDDTCLEECPNAMFAIDQDSAIPSCDFCEFPCQNCGKNATDCSECYPGWTYYEEEGYCYEEIEWIFPFLISCGVAFIIVFAADYYRKSTNFLHSLLFFLCWIEDAVVGYLVLLWINGEVKGNRQLTVISLCSQGVLNLTFGAVHYKFMLGKASVEYEQLYKNYPKSSYFFSIMAYLLNFKSSVILVSQFGGMPRFSGRLSRDAWQKFNIFAMLYICLVYLPFISDFYLYFTENGLRKKTSFIAAEASLIRTIISLILMLEILAQCACSGVAELDLAQRANLTNGKNGKKRSNKRKALRSGMGNEPDYGDYESEEDSWDEELAQVALEADGIHLEQEYSLEDGVEDEESEEEEEFEGVQITSKGKKSTVKGPKKTRLEKLAMQMTEEKNILEQEQKKILEDKIKILEDKEKYLEQFDISKQLEDHRDQIHEDLQKTKDDVDEKIMQKLLSRDTNALVQNNNRPTIILPQPVMAEVEYSRSVEGDEEYWMQNTSAILDQDKDQVFPDEPASENGKQIQVENDASSQKDASQIDSGFEPIDAKRSILGSIREKETDLELKSQFSALNKTERSANIGKSDNILKNTKDSLNNDDAESEMFEEQAPQDKSMKDGTPGALDRSKDDPPMDKSIYHDNTPRIDQSGVSGESDEGVVADHTPFDGIKQATMRSMEELKNPNTDRISNNPIDEGFEGHESSPNINPIFSARNGTSEKKGFNANRSMESVEAEDIQNSGRRRVKQVIYSDKSESSVDDMMDDTPSNYNIANGRLNGKSMGLKGILLHAKHMGIRIGDTDNKTELGAINEENTYNPSLPNAIADKSNLTTTPNNRAFGRGQKNSMDMSSNAEQALANMINPVEGLRMSRHQIASQYELKTKMTNDVSTIDVQNNEVVKSKSKKHPGFKQFEEPRDSVDQNTGRFIPKEKPQKNNFTINSNQQQ